MGVDGGPSELTEASTEFSDSPSDEEGEEEEGEEEREEERSELEPPGSGSEPQQPAAEPAEPFGASQSAISLAESSVASSTGKRARRRRRKPRSPARRPPRGVYDSAQYADKLRALKRELRGARATAQASTAEADALRLMVGELKDALDAVARPASRGVARPDSRAGEAESAFAFMDRRALIDMLEANSQQQTASLQRMGELEMSLKTERQARQRLEAEVFAKQKLLDKAEEGGLTGLQLLASEHQEMTTELERTRNALKDATEELEQLRADFERAVRRGNSSAAATKAARRDKSEADERLQRIELHARHRERVMAIDALTTQCNEAALTIQQIEHEVRVERAHPAIDSPGDVNARRRVQRMQAQLAELREAQRSRVEFLLSLQDKETTQVALFEGAVFGDVRKARDALEAGALVNMADAHGLTPLFHAAGNGHEDVARLLLERGAHTTVDSGLEPPLSGAARGGHVDCIALLVQADADVEARDSAQRTALLAATAHNQPGAVAELLRRGANPGAAGHDGCTPLHVACRDGFEGVATILLQFGASEKVINKNGDFPRQLAAENRHARIIRLLDEHAAEQACEDCAALAAMSHSGIEQACPRHARTLDFSGVGVGGGGGGGDGVSVSVGEGDASMIIPVEPG